jgi:hypothetical protein
LLDSAPSNTGYERMPWWRPDFDSKFAVNLWYWLEDFFQWKPEDRREFVQRKARAWWRKFARKFYRRAGGPAEVDLEDIINLSKFPPHELRLWQIHLNILVNHISRPYGGRVTLFRTKGQPMFCSLEEDFGWGKLVRGGVDIQMIAGSHESIFIEPNVRQLAGRLKSCLNKPSTPSNPPKTELKQT